MNEPLVVETLILGRDGGHQARQAAAGAHGAAHNGLWLIATLPQGLTRHSRMVPVDVDHGAHAAQAPGSRQK